MKKKHPHNTEPYSDVRKLTLPHDPQCNPSQEQSSSDDAIYENGMTFNGSSDYAEFADTLPPESTSPVELHLSAPDFQTKKARSQTLYEPRPRKKPFLKPIYFIIGLICIALVVVGISVLYNSNIQAKTASPMTLKGEPIPNAEFSFMYHYVLLESGIDIYKTGTDKVLAGPGQNGFATLREYFLDAAAREIQITHLLNDDATAKGLEIQDTHKAMAQAYIDWLSKKAAAIGVDLKTYIKGYFGDFVTEDLIRSTLTRRYFTEEYANGAKLDQLKATPEQAEEAYTKNPYQYDLVSYRILRIVFEQTDDSFVATANLRANQIIEGINHDESKFESVAASFFSGEVKDKLLVPNSTLVSNVRYSAVKDKEWRTWLFSKDRQPGDCVIFKDDNGFPILICFSARNRQMEPLRDVRLFYINRENTEKDVAGIPANEILPLAQTIFDNITDEVSMQTLETAYADEIIAGQMKAAHSADTYRGMYTPQIDNWVFDSKRVQGDKIILETKSQVIVAYYAGASANPEWFDRVNSFIRMNNYQAFLLETGTQYPYSLNPDGLEYIKDIPGK